MKNSVGLGLICLLLAGLSGGCADMKLPLSYAPVGQANMGSGPVLIATATDPSQDKNKEGLTILGAVRNGYGMQMSNVVAGDSLSNWVTDACSAQFAQVGYQTQKVDQLPDACPRGLQIEIEHVSSDMDPGFATTGGISRLQFVMAVIRNGQTVEKIRFQATADDRGLLGGGDELENALRKALQNCLKQATQYASAAWNANPVKQ